MVIVTVVRDFQMYGRLVRKNPFNSGAKFCPIDNTILNRGIPTCYNEFLENYDYENDEWIVFCHEDWEVMENFEKILSTLGKGALHGPIGVDFKMDMKGMIFGCSRDGSDFHLVGQSCKTGTVVATFDCQCLIVHSSLVRQHHLRFDEHLKFDLYVEEFCINCSETYEISSKIVSVKCCHHSHGKVEQKFFECLKHVAKKHAHARKSYATIVRGTIICRGPMWKLLLKKAMKFFYQNNVTTHNKRLIKICKIPIWDKKIKIN
ncbi:MAG: hypothetical protein LBB15_01290 [Puniceicoccales bacterium]|jgi:hypothetical protein|nr:hypothetical protein [Puniceicoccales bacterium]